MLDLKCLEYILAEKQAQAACAENSRQLEREISLLKTTIKELT